ncbi:hypothetical protein KCP69_20765 [Salmonella enterica subsp. enterica]|nr:hypothetical protein KCP69_20765 [Salmonella enterica subsp. enterica]
MPRYGHAAISGRSESWGAIGARTTGNPVHRELASGPCPPALKMALMARLKSPLTPSTPPARRIASSVTKCSHSATVNTSGNGDCHIILRGGKAPNYSAQHVAEVKRRPHQSGTDAAGHDRFQPCQLPAISKQMQVCDVRQQIAGGESDYWRDGRESSGGSGTSLESGQPLTYGKSITDACMAGKIPMRCFVSCRQR